MRGLRTFALIFCAVAVLVACASKTEPEKSTPVTGGGGGGGFGGGMSSSAGGPLGEREAELALEQSQKEFLAEHFLKFGDEARARADWPAAQASYAKVLDLQPSNQQARERLDEANAVLGVRPPALRNALDDAEEQRQVQIQQAQMEITNNVKEGQRLEKDGDFEAAILVYEKALLIAGFYPYHADFSPSAEQLRDMIAGATARKVQADKDRRAAELREAAKLKAAEERQLRQQKEQQIAALFRDANLAMSRNQFDLARQYAEQILRLDPTNATAARLARIAKEAKLATMETRARMNLQEQWRVTFEELQKSATPQVADVVFPPEWNELQNLREPYQFTRAKGRSDPKNREIENLLQATTVDIEFENTPLQQAVNFLAQFADVNIVILPAVYDAKSEEELMVTLRADNITVANALELITLTKTLSYRIDKGVVQIGTESEGMGELVLDLYDVKDLTVPIQGFPGEDINLVPSGGFGFGFGEEVEVEPVPQFEGDSLADLVRETIDTQVWDENGTVEFRQGGILIVKAPVETHKKIQSLLSGLRSSGGLTVSIETRFITVENSFLQDIGIDMRDLGDDSGGLGLAGKGRRETFDDVLNGSTGAPAGIGTSQNAGVFYNLNSDGDVRGRVENLLDVALGRDNVLTTSGGTSIQATYLDDTQVEVILRAVQKSKRSTVVVAPKLTAYNGARANVTVLNQVSYIQDFDVEIAQAAQIGDPIIQTLRDGVILDITPIVSADRKYVTLELRPTVAILKRPIQTFNTTLATGSPVTIQLPEINIQRVRTTVTMPDGGILMLGGLKFYEEERMDSTVPFLENIPILSFFFSRKGTYINQRNMIILIKARILVMSELEPRYGGK